MEIANIHEAKSQLSKLIERAMNGKDVIIAETGTSMVRLVPIRRDDRDDSPRQGGQWKGRVRIAEDFDVLPDDFAAALGMGRE
jgi:prevent-host-death family protein